MKNKFFFSLVCLLSIGGNANAQHDTLQTFPFIYCYNCVETGVYHDGVLCTVELLGRPLLFSGPDYTVEFAVHQHSDDVLHAIGIAVGFEYSWGSFEDVLSLYDSSMGKMRAVTIPHVTESWQTWYTDSSYQILTLPGKTNLYNYDFYYDVTDMVLKYAFFDEPIDISGDFYLGFTQCLTSSPTSVCVDFVPSIIEDHYPPYHFEPCNYRYLSQNTWYDSIVEGFIPELFLIIEPECHGVENMRVVTDSTGCVSVEWDTLRWQTQWVLRLEGPDGTRYDTVDTNSHTYCDLVPHTPYEVSVMTQCYRPGGHNWSSWSNTVSLESNAIPSAEMLGSQLILSPNPASGQVDISSPLPMTRIEVHNALGRCLYDRPTSGLTDDLNVSAWPAGTYLLRIHTHTGIITKKLLVR